LLKHVAPLGGKQGGSAAHEDVTARWREQTRQRAPGSPGSSTAPRRERRWQDFRSRAPTTSHRMRPRFAHWPTVIRTVPNSAERASLREGRRGPTQRPYCLLGPGNRGVPRCRWPVGVCAEVSRRAATWNGSTAVNRLLRRRNPRIASCSSASFYDTRWTAQTVIRPDHKSDPSRDFGADRRSDMIIAIA
jgi:hypothetical protein